MASFMVIYLKESLGMTPSFATFLNGTVLWGIIYFMPILGAIVMTLGMFVMALPSLFFSDPSQKTVLLGLSLPIAGIFMIVSIAAMAVGEMMASPRVFEYIGAIAPKGQEGLYLGYQSLPIALASMIGGPVGGRLFERYINTPLKEGRPVDTVTMWLIIVGIGVLSVIGLAIYDRVVVKAKKA
jgi:dipeptide/tripeptide permease